MFTPNSFDDLAHTSTSAQRAVTRAEAALAAYMRDPDPAAMNAAKAALHSAENAINTLRAVQRCLDTSEPGPFRVGSGKIGTTQIGGC